MKKLPITFVILFILILKLNYRAISQTSGFDLKGGFSVPEMFHIGSAYHFNNISLYFSRDIFLTKRWFIQPELGCAIPAFNNTFIKDEMYEGYNLPFIIKFGLNIGYKL